MRDIVHNPAREGFEFSQHKVATPDHETLSVWRIKPKPQQKGRDATILHLHGNAENMSTHFLFTTWLAAEGFDIVTFDYRGYGESTGVPNRTGTIVDAQAVMQWIATHEELGKKPLVVYGQSLGGAIAATALSKGVSPALAKGVQSVRAAVFDCTFESYRLAARDVLGNVWFTWPLQYPLSFLISEDLSPEDYVQNLKIPVFVAHTNEDPVVSIERGRELYRLIGSKRKSFNEVKSKEHTACFAPTQKEMRAKLVSFICDAAPCKK